MSSLGLPIFSPRAPNLSATVRTSPLAQQSPTHRSLTTHITRYRLINSLLFRFLSLLLRRLLDLFRLLCKSCLFLLREVSCVFGLFGTERLEVVQVAAGGHDVYFGTVHIGGDGVPIRYRVRAWYSSASERTGRGKEEIISSGYAKNDPQIHRSKDDDDNSHFSVSVRSGSRTLAKSGVRLGLFRRRGSVLCCDGCVTVRENEEPVSRSADEQVRPDASTARRECPTLTS